MKPFLCFATWIDRGEGGKEEGNCPIGSREVSLTTSQHGATLRQAGVFGCRNPRWEIRYPSDPTWGYTIIYLPVLFSGDYKGDIKWPTKMRMCLSLKWSGKPIKVPTFTRNTWRKPFPKRGLLLGLSVCRWTFRETSAILAKFRLGSSKFHQMVLCMGAFCLHQNGKWIVVLTEQKKWLWVETSLNITKSCHIHQQISFQAHLSRVLS